MHIDPGYFNAILGELIEENPLACQGILSVSRVVFTESVPTLAVTLNEDPPQLLVNLGFIRQHCTAEVHVKTLLLHEFLHVLLNHTGEYSVCDPVTNLALDAVINHLIQRTCGPAYSEFCRLYYGPLRTDNWCVLLAPAESVDHIHYCGAANGAIASLRTGLFRGKVLADDILDLARDIAKGGKLDLTGRVFLGNHDPNRQAGTRPDRQLSEVAVRALDETFRQLNGDGIFREPLKHGFARPLAADREWNAREEKLRAWERTAWKTLHPLLTPDLKSACFDWEERPAALPVLHAGDRRGFLRALWNPLVPEIRWNLPARRPAGTTVVYLDVSGSMNLEMQSLVTLLNRLRRWIRLPFWAFSDVVAPATIERGVLKTRSTGGTAINCVLAHLAKTRPEKALVVTDGYIEPCDPALVRAARGTTLHALISRNGNPARLIQAGIPCTQLAAFPEA